MLPLIETEVVDRRRWLSKESFIDVTAIAQSSPGVFAINMSVFVGYRLRGLRGALVTALGTALPSFVIILLLAMCFVHVTDNAVVASIFRGIRPAVVALIAVPTWNMAVSAKINLSNCWIPLGGALLIYLLGVNPIYVILAAAFGGYLYGQFVQPTEAKSSDVDGAAHHHGEAEDKEV